MMKTKAIQQISWVRLWMEDYTILQDFCSRHGPCQLIKQHDPPSSLGRYFLWLDSQAFQGGGSLFTAKVNSRMKSPCWATKAFPLRGCALLWALFIATDHWGFIVDWHFSLYRLVFLSGIGILAYISFLSSWALHNHKSISKRAYCKRVLIQETAFH